MFSSGKVYMTTLTTTACTVMSRPKLSVWFLTTASRLLSIFYETELFSHKLNIGAHVEYDLQNTDI